MSDRSSEDRQPTIFAVASGTGRAAISVVRLSGPRAGDILASMTAGSLPPPRRAVLRRLRDPVSLEVLDQAVCLWFPGPASFTGDDQVELHVHGGAAVRAAILRALSKQSDCRVAEPGEFTRRAFLNGRLDLTAVEGLADLIDAETEAQRRQAVRQLEGQLATCVASWTERVADALARCEAILDFSDEDDVPAGIADEVGSVARGVSREIGAALAGAGRAERIRDGVTVVIAGPPNAGKSTLLNALARREVAIVSTRPGTTRDAIEVRCDLDGFAVTFVDTAGLRQSDDEIEREGMARTAAHIRAADVVLWLAPAGEPADSEDRRPGGSRLVVTKVDQSGKYETAEPDVIRISAVTGEGMSRLLDEIRSLVAARPDGDAALLTRERHRQVLTDAEGCLMRAAEIAPDPDATELLAEDLRLALRALGRMSGQVGSEDILDRVFASFCIGK